MLLFTVGPVMMYPETLKEDGKQPPYFRTKEFSEMMIESEVMLKTLIGADEEDKVAFLTMSGTGAMEATVINIFDSEDKVLIINGGSFGQRFEEICYIHKIPFESVNLEFGEKLNEEHLYKFHDTGITGLLVNIDETSTGQLYDIEVLSDFCKKENAYLVVDAISSFLADEYNMNEMGIDATIISSQKALSLEPGMAMVIIKKRLFDERIVHNNPKTLYMDLKLHFKNMERGQTPFTPAVRTLISMNKILKSICEKGLKNKIEETHELASFFRQEAKKAGLNVPEYPLSNAVTPIIFERGAYLIFEKLREQYDITVTPSGGELKEKMIRIGHLGNLNKDDYILLVKSIISVLS